MSILPLAADAVTGHDGCMGSQNVAEDDVGGVPAAVCPQEPGRRAGRPGWRWLGRARTLPGGVGAWAALLVVWLVWGSTYIAIRVGDESLPPLAVAGTRYLIAGALLFPATVPIWMVLADRVINGRAIPRAGWAALILGVAGVAILAR
jgi:hypothetical protein